MTIKIYVHPEFKDTFWTQLTLKATAAEITRKRYTAEYLEAESVTDLAFDKIYAEDERRLLLYIGHSVAGTPRDLKYLTDHGIHIILINYESSVLAGNCSKVLLNYRDGMQKIISYFTANDHDRIALFGINPNSSTDMLKDSYFVEFLRERGGNPTRDIYYNYGSISGCFSRFAENRSDYNAVICANDVVALALMRFLQESGVRVPEDLYVAACGGSSLINSTITSVFADQYELGRQAVLTYAHLYKNPCAVALSVKVEAKLTVRASTDFAPDPGEDLLGCDELDRGILTGILAGETYPMLAEKLYTSENVISYRIKKMCSVTGTSKKSELIALIRPYM